MPSKCIFGGIDASRNVSDPKTQSLWGPWIQKGTHRCIRQQHLPLQDLSLPGQGHRQANRALTLAHAPPRGLELKRSSPTAKSSLQTTKIFILA